MMERLEQAKEIVRILSRDRIIEKSSPIYMNSFNLSIIGDGTARKTIGSIDIREDNSLKNNEIKRNGKIYKIKSDFKTLFSQMT